MFARIAHNLQIRHKPRRPRWMSISSKRWLIAATSTARRSWPASRPVSPSMLDSQLYAKVTLAVFARNALRQASPEAGVTKDGLSVIALPQIVGAGAAGLSGLPWPAAALAGAAVYLLTELSTRDAPALQRLSNWQVGAWRT